MSRHTRHVVDDVQAGKRLDRALASLPEMHSRAFAARLADDGHVLVNGAPANKSHVLRAGDVVDIELEPPKPSELVAEDVHLDVRYEDDSLVILSKPAGMVVHPAHGHRSGTLVHALLGHGREFGAMGGSERPGIVHRLDKDTSGLMVVAKDEATQAALAADLKARNVERRYIALVHGVVAPDTGLVDAPLGRDPSDRMRVAVNDGPGSRSAQTSFTVLARWSGEANDDGYTLLECRLHTGRTHQIRVHLAYIRHPVVGDPAYGRRGAEGALGLGRQFLHAWMLRLEHPLTGEQLLVIDQLPQDLGEVVRKLSARPASLTKRGAEVFSQLGIAEDTGVSPQNG